MAVGDNGTNGIGGGRFRNERVWGRQAVSCTGTGKGRCRIWEQYESRPCLIWMWLTGGGSGGREINNGLKCSTEESRNWVRRRARRWNSVGSYGKLDIFRGKVDSQGLWTRDKTAISNRGPVFRCVTRRDGRRALTRHNFIRQKLQMPSEASV